MKFDPTKNVHYDEKLAKIGQDEKPKEETENNEENKEGGKE